jgi:TonB family protein
MLAQLVHDIEAAGARVLERAPGADAAGPDVTTQIEVRYTTGGLIRSIRVAQSSGSQAFDQQALSVARNTRFPEVPQQLHSREFSVKFPIVFRAAH